MKNKSIISFLILTLNLNCLISPIREKYWEDIVFTYYYRDLKNEELYSRYRIKNNDDKSNKFGILTVTQKEILKNSKRYFEISDFAIRYYVKKTVVEENFEGSIILNTFQYENKSQQGSVDILTVFTRSDPNSFLINLIENKVNHLARNRTPLVFSKKYLDNLNLNDINTCLKSKKLSIESEYKNSQSDIMQNE